MQTTTTNKRREPTTTPFVFEIDNGDENQKERQKQYCSLDFLIWKKPKGDDDDDEFTEL